ncbi:helix-turn-helix domain-containing protein [Paraburkholderia hiiakae]|uniref:helix-turn-helix domain-containing protein n=1 Tax=Paraburkholderia hiiakae TaxID=1081782 RepID=UPI001919C6F3|nr:helix-turn-helix transcriptional regulator [Paraburkholderia hiiakae]
MFSAPAVPVETPAESDASPPGEPANDTPWRLHLTVKPARTATYGTPFPRACAQIPNEVAASIAGGTYFLRAWRDYRRYETRDTAELVSLSEKTVIWHEQGYNKPGKETLRRFATVFDCSIEQLTAISNANEQEIKKDCEKEESVKTAPIDTDYPDTVLDHIRSGKSPVTAWRIYRRLTDKQLADCFGTSVALLHEMVERDRMSDKTLKKFGEIFRCTLDQLRRPEGLVVEPHKVRPVAMTHLATNGVQVASAA